ncbi:hypothetical protein AG4045_013097 [Apium graveolens]|uniref:Cytidine/deoxycytidylate deaminase zinc-binding domain-containing protein n=1 Tax=Apium graveolens TaxID=4045 RepID=A0A6L5B909_APIGR|nr:hypothetical protein AG4045_013097 [Apium graveolens]
MDVNGKFHKGCYMESASYNPSLGPVQAALVAFVASGGGGYDEIVAAVLVEKEEAVVRQGDTARLLLKMVSPNCDFRVFLLLFISKWMCVKELTWFGQISIVIHLMLKCCSELVER